MPKVTTGHRIRERPMSICVIMPLFFRTFQWLEIVIMNGESAKITISRHLEIFELKEIWHSGNFCHLWIFHSLIYCSVTFDIWWPVICCLWQSVTLYHSMICHDSASTLAASSFTDSTSANCFRGESGMWNFLQKYWIVTYEQALQCCCSVISWYATYQI